MYSYHTIMRAKLFLAFILSSLISLPGFAQINGKTNPLPPGYPDRSANLDVYPGFKNPPAGYGEVSFYWWLGDTLTKERITWQLDQLAGRSITGLQVNYAHSDEGGNIWGLTYPGKPRLFSKDWWDLFSWFLQEAKKRGMSVSLSDYTLGIAGQGWFVDEMLAENPGLYGSRLLSRQYDIRPDVDTLIDIPDNLLSAVAYQTESGNVAAGSGKPVSQNPGGKLQISAEKSFRKIVLVSFETVKTSFDPMNPLSGEKVIEKFFQPFEDHCPGEAGKGLNFFFSDELNFGISGLLWNNRFASEFRKRKGYDILPEISGLFADIGPRTPKVRIDYNDVLVALSEESFFIPIYKWHTDRGMLYGCDHGGRGLDVTEFGDYFRAQRWMSGPGCDQPVLDRNINKNKVASSISHLYERPRTWLEGYHSSGWGTSSAQLADATFTNYAMGQNLLSLHGLYYSTHGGWWEWAPPDNHFRQPYWALMGDFLMCTERLSYLLSQGYHRCDVAVLYPVTPMVAGMKGNEAVSTAFAAGEKLYKSGIDYDFIDFESLARAKVRDGELQVSGEKYKVLILPAMTAVRFSTLEKALSFFEAGGIVIAIGSLPEASERIGRDDPSIKSMVSKIFDSGKENGLHLDKPEAISAAVERLITIDFKALYEGAQPYVMHRKIGTRDIYYLYGVPKDSVCFFRCSGKAELWDPWTGLSKALPVFNSSNLGTRIKMPLTASEPQLIVFSQGEPEIAASDETAHASTETILVGDWEFELKPTLDNRWGDYRQPAYAGYVATDANVIRYKQETEAEPGWQSATVDDSKWENIQISYGPQFWKLGPLPDTIESLLPEATLASLKSIDPAKPVVIGGHSYYWSPYEFSWRWGLKGNPGRQGYHGLKEWIHDDIFQFGEAVRDWPGVPQPRIVPEKAGSTYFLWSTVISETDQQAKIVRGGVAPARVWVNANAMTLPLESAGLQKGSNTLLLKYVGAGTGYFVFENAGGNADRKQTIPLAGSWYGNASVLPFDLTPEAANPAGWYRFKSPPGLQSIEIAASRKPACWVNGREVPVKETPAIVGIYADPSLHSWKAEVSFPVAASTQIALRIPMNRGYYGGAACPEPIRMNCGKGIIRLGDLFENESLMTYSGGMWYRKTIVLTTEQAKSSRLVLDLGELVSTAEVYVNGQLAGKRLAPPWRFDLQRLVKSGENRLEVLIYNTLGNYYLTTPSKYVGSTRSGLIGPVRLLTD